MCHPDNKLTLKYLNISLLQPAVDIGSIVSQRLTAMRRLQENPNDVQALTQIYKSNKEVCSTINNKLIQSTTYTFIYRCSLGLQANSSQGSLRALRGPRF